MPVFNMSTFTPEGNPSKNYNNKEVVRGKLEGSAKDWLCESFYKSTVSLTIIEKRQLLAREFMRVIAPYQPETRLAKNVDNGSYSMLSEIIPEAEEFSGLPINKAQQFVNGTFTGLGQVVAVSMVLQNINLGYKSLALDKEKRVIIKNTWCFDHHWHSEPKHLNQDAIEELPYPPYYYRPRYWFDFGISGRGGFISEFLSRELCTCKPFRDEVNQAILKMCLMPPSFIDKLVYACIDEEREQRQLSKLIKGYRKDLINAVLINKSFNEYIKSAELVNQDINELLTQMKSFQVGGIDVYLNEDERQQLMDDFIQPNIKIDDYLKAQPLLTLSQGIKECEALIAYCTTLIGDLKLTNDVGMMRDVNSFSANLKDLVQKPMKRDKNADVEYLRNNILHHCKYIFRKQVSKFKQQGIVFDNESLLPESGIEDLEDLKKYQKDVNLCLINAKNEAFKLTKTSCLELVKAINSSLPDYKDKESFAAEFNAESAKIEGDLDKLKLMEKWLSKRCSDLREQERALVLCREKVTTLVNCLNVSLPEEDQHYISGIKSAEKNINQLDLNGVKEIEKKLSEIRKKVDAKNELIKAVEQALSIIVDLEERLERKYDINEPICKSNKILIEKLTGHLKQYKDGNDLNPSELKKQVEATILDQKSTFKTHRDPWYKKVLGYIADCFAGLMANSEEKKIRAGAHQFFDSPDRVTKSGNILFKFHCQMKSAFEYSDNVEKKLSQ
jgi:hypothetical protein